MWERKEFLRSSSYMPKIVVVYHQKLFLMICEPNIYLGPVSFVESKERFASGSPEASPYLRLPLGLHLRRSFPGRTVHLSIIRVIIIRASIIRVRGFLE